MIHVLNADYTIHVYTWCYPIYSENRNGGMEEWRNGEWRNGEWEHTHVPWHPVGGYQV